MPNVNSTPELLAKWPRPRALEIQAIISKMNLCGCGSASHWECVLELLCRAEDHKARGSFYGESGSPIAPWIEFGAKVLDSFGLIDHGTGIGWAWLTDDGETLIAFLKDFGTDEDQHPDWIQEFGWTDVPDDKYTDSYEAWAVGYPK